MPITRTYPKCAIFEVTESPDSLPSGLSCPETSMPRLIQAEARREHHIPRPRCFWRAALLSSPAAKSPESSDSLLDRLASLQYSTVQYQRALFPFSSSQGYPTYDGPHASVMRRPPGNNAASKVRGGYWIFSKYSTAQTRRKPTAGKAPRPWKEKWRYFGFRSRISMCWLGERNGNSNSCRMGRRRSPCTLYGG